MFDFLNEYYDAIRGGGESAKAADSAVEAVDERHSTVDGTSVLSARCCTHKHFTPTTIVPSPTFL